MLFDRGKINRELIRMMEGWRHSGFNVYSVPRIHPRQNRSLERLAAYLIRSSFSQQRMEYRPVEGEMTYLSKDRKEKRSYNAPESLAPMGSHVPEKGQQSVRYYGAYANSTTYGTSFSLTHKSLPSYSVSNRKKIPVDYRYVQGYKRMSSQDRNLEPAIPEKIRSLPPDKIGRVEDFIDFLIQRGEDRLLTRTASAHSESSFHNTWDNPEDADHDRL